MPAQLEPASTFLFQQQLLAWKCSQITDFITKPETVNSLIPAFH